MATIGLLAIFATAVVGSYVSTRIFSPRLRRAGIVGVDVHKRARTEIPEMGGLAVVAGFGAATLLGIALVTFYHLFSVRLVEVLADVQ